MESLLECGILDNLSTPLLQQLSVYVLKRQTEKSKFTRTPEYVDGILAKYWDWLADEDIPSYIDPAARAPPKELKPRIQKGAQRPVMIPAGQASGGGLKKQTSGDEIFAMDLHDAPATPAQQSAPPSQVASGSGTHAPAKGWKVMEAPRSVQCFLGFPTPLNNII